MVDAYVVRTLMLGGLTVLAFIQEHPLVGVILLVALVLTAFEAL